MSSYFNNSERYMGEIYRQQLVERASFEAKQLYEAMGGSTRKFLMGTEDRANRMYNDIVKFQKVLNDDPKRFTMFVKDIEAEKAKFEKIKKNVKEIHDKAKELQDMFKDVESDF